MAELVRLMKRPHAAGPYVAARYVYGEPLDDVRQVALLGSQAVQLAEVPIWQVLLVRTGPPSHDPFYEVVCDGTWLVYDPETGNLAAWDDDELAGEFRPLEDGRTVALGPARAEADAQKIADVIIATFADPALGLTAEQQADAKVIAAGHLQGLAASEEEARHG